MGVVKIILRSGPYYSKKWSILFLQRGPYSSKKCSIFVDWMESGPYYLRSGPFFGEWSIFVESGSWLIYSLAHQSKGFRFPLLWLSVLFLCVSVCMLALSLSKKKGHSLEQYVRNWPVHFFFFKTTNMFEIDIHTTISFILWRRIYISENIVKKMHYYI